ncbi:BLUF domain-containing protein [uncultured Hymenobacter sp.]|uniref:BLUF domain-containing protein n=1 Tax=uncultured Hymenobacter sp. TaxID=170016 RepID=UPI0035CA74CF
MIHIIYISRAVHPLSDQDLQALLSQCRRDNAQHNVTGVLFYSHGNIAQLIEGEPEILEPLFEKISRDGRHSNVVKLVSKLISVRSFPDWSMAFHPLEPVGFETLQGFWRPNYMPSAPISLTIADATLLDLIRLAVFGADASIPSALPNE